MTHISRRMALGLGLAGAATVVAQPVMAAPKARLIDRRWAQFGTAAAPDHGLWDAILRKHRSMGRDGIARFAYANAPTAEVEAYLTQLANIDPVTLRQGDAFAYWVNLYNAVTVRAVLNAWPVGSIRDIGGGVFSSGPWRQKLVRIAGKQLSLDDIEHGILRPIWRDARIHYVVNCASRGCPDLSARAFTGRGLGAALDGAARAYVNHPRGARVEGGRLIVSSIYHWYKSDFGGTDAGVIAHLKAHADPQLGAALQQVTRIADHGYDWAVNAG